MDRASDDAERTVLRHHAPVRPAGYAPGADTADTVIRLIEPSPPAAGSDRSRALPNDDASLASLGGDDLPEATAPSLDVAWLVRVRGTSPLVALDVPVVVGRRPGAARPNEHPAPRQLVVPADRRDVSSRHARIEQLGQSLVVTDLGSTNGVVVHWSSGAVLRLRPNDSCVVLPDAVIAIGDGVEIEFVAPDTLSPPQPSEPS